MFPRREPGRPWRLLALILALALVTTAAPALAQPPRAERPTYRVGDTWLRTDGAYTLTRIDGDVYVFVAPGEREIHLTKDLVITKVVDQGAVQWAIDPAPLIQWPLTAGTKGVETATLVTARGGSASVTVTWSVEAFERVSVQARTLEAFRVVLRFTPLGGVAATAASVMYSEFWFWYAPAAGQIVKMAHASEISQLTAELSATSAAERPVPAPLAAAPAPPTPAPSPEARAVVIGVGRHDSRDIPTLSYTVSDAEAMYDALVTVGGFKKENVLLLTDRSERPPTLRNIKWALGTFLARSAGRQDTVIIYFAGHGAPEVDQRGLERDGLAKYLIPSDADAEDLYSTALPMDELQTIFGRLESERVVAFLDACFSGAAGGRTFTSRRTRAGGVDDTFLERLTRARGRAIVTASRAAEVALELPELGHGVFTYYLVQGLRGVADANRDEVVTLQELYEYVAQQVSRKARAVGGKQNPMFKGELEGVLPLVKLGRH